MSALVEPVTSVSAAETDMRYTVTVVRGERELRQHLDAWNDLVHHLTEPNAFYEPWALLPAIRRFAGGLDVSVALVYLSAPGDHPQPLLCGLLPLRRRRLSPLLPIAVVEPWQHLYCFLCTPLLRDGHAIPALEALFDWLSGDSLGAPLIRLKNVSGDGGFAKALAAVCHRRKRPTHTVESYCRAVIEPRIDPDLYVSEALHSRRYKSYRKKLRGLAKHGIVEHRVFGPGDCPATWAEMFLKLEQKGWKGRQGTAMACAPADAAFFVELVEGAASAGSLIMLGLFLNGEPLALECSLSSGAGGFGFKIAFDEDHASSSPGWLLQLDTIKLLHSGIGVEWMDSCAMPGNSIDHLWTERRLITTQWVATGRAPGDLLLSMLPFGSWLIRRVRRPAEPKLPTA